MAILFVMSYTNADTIAYFIEPSQTKHSENNKQNKWKI